MCSGCGKTAVNHETEPSNLEPCKEGIEAVKEQAGKKEGEDRHWSHDDAPAFYKED